MKNATTMNTKSQKSSKSQKNGNKVNTSTLTPIAISNLSDFHKASVALAKISATYSANKKEAEAALQKAKDSRAKNASVSIAKEIGKLDALATQYKKDCEPYKKAQSEVYKMIDDCFYYAYKIANEKGNMKACGEVTIVKGKGDKATTTRFNVTSKTTLMAYTKDFLEKLGVTNLDNELALDKVGAVINTRCLGRQVDTKTGYTKDRNMSGQKKLFVCAIIDYLVNDRHALVALEDGTLCKKSDLVKAEEKTEA